MKVQKKKPSFNYLSTKRDLSILRITFKYEEEEEKNWIISMKNEMGLVGYRLIQLNPTF